MPVPTSTSVSHVADARVEAALEQVEGQRTRRDEEHEDPDRPVVEPVVELVPVANLPIGVALDVTRGGLQLCSWTCGTGQRRREVGPPIRILQAGGPVVRDGPVAKRDAPVGRPRGRSPRRASPRRPCGLRTPAGAAPVARSARRLRVERRGGLVHQQHQRLDRPAHGRSPRAGPRRPTARAAWPLPGADAERLQQLARLRARRPRARCRSTCTGARHTLSSARQVREEVVELEHDADAPVQIARRLAASAAVRPERRRRPPRWRRPRSARARPMARRIVVLPDPDAPSSATSSPRRRRTTRRARWPALGARHRHGPRHATALTAVATAARGAGPAAPAAATAPDTSPRTTRPARTQLPMLAAKIDVCFVSSTTVMTDTSELSLSSATKSLVIGASASAKGLRTAHESQRLPVA